MKTSFSSSDIKLLAMGTMVLDHGAIGLLYLSGLTADPLWQNVYTAMRLLGRMAFPLYAFLAAEGFLHTRSWKNYALRLAVLAAISEIPFNLIAGGTFFYPQAQNTVATLLLGVVAARGLELLGIGPRGGGEPQESSRELLLVAFLLAALFRTDYGMGGVLLILVFYRFRYQPNLRLFAGCVLLFFMYWGFPLDSLFAWIAFFFINRYNGEKGRNLGRLPYVFYPAHLLLFYAAGVFIHGIYF